MCRYLWFNIYVGIHDSVYMIRHIYLGLLWWYVYDLTSILRSSVVRCLWFLISTLVIGGSVICTVGVCTSVIYTSFICTSVFCVSGIATLVYMVHPPWFSIHSWVGVCYTGSAKVFTFHLLVYSFIPPWIHMRLLNLATMNMPKSSLPEKFLSDPAIPRFLGFTTWWCLYIYTYQVFTHAN